MRTKSQHIVKVKAPKSGSERLELVLDPNWIPTPDDVRDDDRDDFQLRPSASNHSNHSASTAETDNRSCSRVTRTFSLESDGSVSRTEFERDVYKEMERRGYAYDRAMEEVAEEEYYEDDEKENDLREDENENEYYADLEEDVSALQNLSNAEREQVEDNNVHLYDGNAQHVSANSVMQGNSYDEDGDMQYYINNGACVIMDAVSDNQAENDVTPDDEPEPVENQLLSAISRDYDDEQGHPMLGAMSPDSDIDCDVNDTNAEYTQPLENGDHSVDKTPPRRGVSFDEEFLNNSDRSPTKVRAPLRRMQSDDTSVSSVGYRVVTTISKEKMAPVPMLKRTASPSILREPKYSSTPTNVSTQSFFGDDDAAKPIPIKKVSKKPILKEKVSSLTTDSVCSPFAAETAVNPPQPRAPSPMNESITSPSGVSVQSHGSNRSNNAVGQLVQTKQEAKDRLPSTPQQQQRQLQTLQQQSPQQHPQQQVQERKPLQKIHHVENQAQVDPWVQCNAIPSPRLARSHSGLSGFSEGMRSTAALDGYPIQPAPKKKGFLGLLSKKKQTKKRFPITSTLNETKGSLKKTRLMKKFFGRKNKPAAVAENEHYNNAHNMRNHMSPRDPNPDKFFDAPVPAILTSSRPMRVRTGARLMEDDVSVASRHSAASRKSTKSQQSSTSNTSHLSRQSHNSQQSNKSHQVSLDRPRSPSPHLQLQPSPRASNDNNSEIGRSTSRLTDTNPWVADDSPSSFDIPPNNSLVTVTRIANAEASQDPNATDNLPNDSVPNTNPPDGSYDLNGSGMPSFKWWTWSQPDENSKAEKDSRYCALMCVFPPEAE